MDRIIANPPVNYSLLEPRGDQYAGTQGTSVPRDIVMALSNKDITIKQIGQVKQTDKLVLQYSIVWSPQCRISEVAGGALHLLSGHVSEQ